MKIALCLSGQMRAMRHCLDTIETAFPDCDIDVYASTWYNYDVKDRALLFDNFNVKSFDAFKNIDLKKHSLFEQKVINKGFSAIPARSVTNWAPLPVWNLTRIELMAQNNFNRLKETTTEYNFIVRSRFDTRYLTNLKPLLSDKFILVSEDIGGSAPWDSWKGVRQVFDGFAAGPYRLMSEYYEFPDWIAEHYFKEHNEVLKAERTLGWFLYKKRLNLNHVADILGIQVNQNEWYNRANPILSNSLKEKQKGTFDFYKKDLKSVFPDLYDRYSRVFND